MKKTPNLTQEQIRNGARIFRELIREAENVQHPDFSRYWDEYFFHYNFSSEVIYGNLMPIKDRAFKIAEKLFGDDKECVSQLKKTFYYDDADLTNFPYNLFPERWVTLPERANWRFSQLKYFVEQWSEDRQQFINLLKEILDEIETSRSDEKGAKMAKTEVRLGDGTIIYGNLVTANSIKSSFNQITDSKIPEELKETLTSLAKAVAQMVENLPEEQAQQVSQDLEVLTAEAISKTPRKQWIHLSADGLKEAARSIGEIGTPVLELVGKILPLLIPSS